MNKKLLKRLLCAFLSVLTLVCAVPAFALPVAASSTTGEGVIDYTKVYYDSAEERLASMTLEYSDEQYELYCDEVLGTVAYRNKLTGEVLFTNPWDMEAEKNTYEKVNHEIMSQIQLTYTDAQKKPETLNSYTDAALKGQITVKPIKGGIRVEYAIGELSSRILLPRQIEKSRFEALLAEFAENVPKGKNSWEYKQFAAYYSPYSSGVPAVEERFPVLKKKDMTIYVCDTKASEAQLRTLEEYVKAYLPDYTFEDMDNDHDVTEYQEDSMSPPVFKMALEYVIDGNGLSVTLPANGLRYDESVYRITELKVLPYMGASLKSNEGYSFVPDGAGALYSLETPVLDRNFAVYGDDFSVSNLVASHNETVRMPVFGQVETLANGTKRGFLAIIEEGDSLATISPSHLTDRRHVSVIPSFTTRQVDVSQSSWTLYACRRYTGDYKLRYILLTDDTAAANAGLTKWYECSWMGMACAYRDYLDGGAENGFDRLTAEDVDADKIPLYIETFGCMDTIEKVLSMPVTVSVALTTFEDIRTMYDYLASQGVTNVNFKMTGYANGGLYSEVPYKLKWNKSVGGASGFKDLAEYAKEKGFELYPDFDFVYTSHSDTGSAVNFKKNAARTIENRYTSRRTYSATQQVLVSYYQMVLSPATYSKFYEKLAKKYSKYDDATAISLSTFGDALNSDYDENKTVLREETKHYVMEALSYFKKDYNVMVDGGNAYTWSSVDHILGIPLDSSRYNAEYASVPFVGVVLHGYVEYAGSAFNMEGDLRYAMLKAMENGASVYFILSYANTALLKEDELLSQNYSVRYDIWQKRLVEVYNELNEVLADVQTSLIVDHQFLEDSKRVPDQDELMADIAEEAQKYADAIAAKLEADNQQVANALRNDKNIAANAKDLIAANEEGLKTLIQDMNARRFGSTETRLQAAWKKCLEELDGESQQVSKDSAKSLSDLFNTIVKYYVAAKNNKTDAEKNLAAAKAALERLKDAKANAALITEAENGVSNAINAYVDFMTLYNGREMIVDAEAAKNYIENSDATLEALIAAVVSAVAGEETVVAEDDLKAFILDNDQTVNSEYANSLGVEALYRAFVDLLTKHGFNNETVVNVQKLEQEAGAAQDTQHVHDFDTEWSYDATHHWHACKGDGCEEVQDYEEHLFIEKVVTPEDDKDGDATEGEKTDETPVVQMECSGCHYVDSGNSIVPDSAKDKYSIDNKVVVVSYGESKDKIVKSLLLNFNDYTIQVDYNGITYTVEGYGYVVIKPSK